MKNIVIIGGSIGGLSAALVLASAINDDFKLNITIIDDDKPDLKAVAIYNTPLFPAGIKGAEIINHVKEQINNLAKVDYIKASATAIEGTKGDFKVSFSEDDANKDLKADYIIVATGASKCDIKGLEDFIIAHELMNKPNKIKLKNQGRQMIKDGIYAAGLASGVTTMVTCAMGSGGEAACAILSDIKGEVSIIHDTPSTRKL